MKISVVIVNFNTRDLLFHCLDSIQKETKKVNYEVIVVDNASTDGSVAGINKGLEIKHLQVISNKKNVGFGAANNQGAKLARGEWLLFLNSDTKLCDNTIDTLFTKIRDTKYPIQRTVFGCQLLNPDGSIQPSAGYFPTLLRVALQMLFLDDLLTIKKLIKPYQQTDPNFYTKEQEVDWVTGAFLLVPKALFDQVGGFDETIFMYGEEVDLCYRLKQAGARTLFAPVAKLIHYKGASSVDGFGAAVVGEYKGLLTFYQKHWPHHLGQLRLFLRIGAWLRVVLFALFDPPKSRVYYEALKKLA